MIGLHKSHVMGCVISFKLEPMIDPTFQGRPSMCQPFTNYFDDSDVHHVTTTYNDSIDLWRHILPMGGKVHLARQPQLSDVLRQIFSRGGS